MHYAFIFITIWPLRFPETFVESCVGESWHSHRPESAEATKLFGYFAISSDREELRA